MEEFHIFTEEELDKEEDFDILKIANKYNDSLKVIIENLCGRLKNKENLLKEAKMAYQKQAIIANRAIEIASERFNEIKKLKEKIKNLEKNINGNNIHV